jgi:uncharacterized protein (DUF433 family)
MNTISVSKEHIVITPGICGGKPTAGHRIKVQDIVIWHERMGMSPDEIIYQHPRFYSFKKSVKIILF